MIILGTGGSDHDFGAALLRDGELIAAIEDERVTRIRHGKSNWYEVPVRPSIEWCLETAGIGIDSVNYFTTNLHLEKRARFPFDKKFDYVGHHLSHAACVFYTSPFESATAVIIDGAGHRLQETTERVELETVSIGTGSGQNLYIASIQSGTREIATCFWRYMCSNSLGAFYEAVTDLIGFGSYGAGKTMGLAPYGSGRLISEMRQFVSILPEGRFSFDPYGGIFDWMADCLSHSNNDFMIRADLAFAAQQIFEDVLINVLNYAYHVHPSENLVYSGGCALNTAANGKIRERTPFRNLFIHPANR